MNFTADISLEITYIEDNNSSAHHFSMVHSMSSSVTSTEVVLPPVKSVPLMVIRVPPDFGPNDGSVLLMLGAEKRKFPIQGKHLRHLQ